MIFFAVFVVTLLILTGIGVMIFRHTQTVIVAEDNVAVTVNKDGFIKRVLTEGRHVLHPTERVELAVETRTKLAMGRAIDIATSDGILVKIDWSGTYSLNPGLIATEGKSQKLRNLPNADKAISRNADLTLRRLVGNHMVPNLFDPTVRENLEKRLSQTMIDRLKPLGIVLNGVNLQAIELPSEVAEALNKAKAIETLDGAIRQVDPTTREVVRGAYQLDEILHWDAYLPVPTRKTMKRFESAAQR